MAFDTLNDVSDEALLIAFGNGDMQAARALTLRLTPKIVGFSARMLGGDVTAKSRAHAREMLKKASATR